MKLIKHISVVTVVVSLLAGPSLGFAADEKKTAAKPYTLETCAVSDEKLGDMGKPFVFEHQGQEIKLCCKSCKKDFDKNPDKFMKKIAQADKKSDKKAAKPAAPGAHHGHAHDDHTGHNH
jgi:YHS domain-containing protein